MTSQRPHIEALVNHLGGHKNFRGLCRAEGILRDMSGLGVMVASAELLQLLVLVVNLAAGADVDGKGDENHDPG